MIDKVQISEKELNDLHAKGALLDPNSFNLENISHSGMHVGDVADHSEVVQEYNLDALSNSGRHSQDIIDE